MIRAFMIVVKDDPRSEFYYNMAKETWTSDYFELERFDAITPKDLKENPPKIRFTYHDSGKYRKVGIRKVMTETEKACFASHWSLWKKIRDENIENNLILEHDAYLKDLDTFLYMYRRRDDCQTFGIGADAYTMRVDFAEYLCKTVNTYAVNGGPLGWMEYYAVDAGYSFFSAALEPDRPVYHIYNEDVGNTIDHFSTLPEEVIEQLNEIVEYPILETNPTLTIVSKEGEILNKGAITPSAAKAEKKRKLEKR